MCVGQQTREISAFHEILNKVQKPDWRKFTAVPISFETILLPVFYLQTLALLVMRRGKPLLDKYLNIYDDKLQGRTKTQG